MLRQYEKVRRDGMQHYGFGIDAMRRIKICSDCGEMICAKEKICQCGAPLSEETLYEVYVKRHRHCQACGAIVNNDVHFCPDCGVRLSEQTNRNKEENEQ